MVINGDINGDLCKLLSFLPRLYFVSDHRYAHLAPRLVTCGLENSTSPR